MKKVYMVADYWDKKAKSIQGCPDIGVEYMGNCGGRIMHEDGTVIGYHHSSSFGFLRSDLKSKLNKDEEYEIVDLIGKEIPDKFRIIPRDVQEI